MTNNISVRALFTNTTTEVYLFAPVNHKIKVFFASTNVMAAVLSFHANSLILYFSYKKPKFNITRSFNREKLINCYIQSLALTSVLCALLSAPVFTAELFVDFIKTNLTCTIVRSLTMYFPIATVLNYLTIGRERYLAVCKPFNVPSVQAGKKLIVSAWFIAAVVIVVLRPSYKLVGCDLDNNKYTHTCKYDHTSQTSRILFLSSTIITWVIPCMYLTVTNFLTLKYLRQQQRSVEGIFPRVSRENVYRYKTSRMFVCLIFAFVTPFMFFMFYSGLVMLLKLNISFTVDYVTRYLIGFLVYANGVISTLVLFHFSSYHRRKLRELFRRDF